VARAPGDLGLLVEARQLQDQGGQARSRLQVHQAAVQFRVFQHDHPTQAPDQGLRQIRGFARQRAGAAGDQAQDGWPTGPGMPRQGLSQAQGRRAGAGGGGTVGRYGAGADQDDTPQWLCLQDPVGRLPGVARKHAGARGGQESSRFLGVGRQDHPGSLKAGRDRFGYGSPGQREDAAICPGPCLDGGLGQSW